MIHKIPIDQFLQLSETLPVFDVRTNSEFIKGHIPEAHNLPLFTDDERAIVGTIYNKQGREKAILQGLDFVGPRMRSMVETIEKETNSRSVLIHCWRGGMRSGSVAWLVNFFGYEIYTLDGGYKSFRNHVINQFEKKYPFVVIGGRTGSGKTKILHQLKANNQQIIDLEGLGNHKGSAFGAIGQPQQPRQEHFENMLGTELGKLDLSKPVFIEDESRKVGGLQIPNPIWDQLRNSPVIFIDVPLQHRINYLVAEYGKEDLTELGKSILRIRENLGGANTKLAVDFLGQNDLENCCKILLDYYDKTYDYGLSIRENISLKKVMSESEYLIDEIVKSAEEFKMHNPV